MSFEKDFKGKTVIVTGGARGIGRGVCLALSKFGAKVYAISKSPETLKKLKDECPAIETIAVDLGDWKETKEAVEKIETVDMLVNNAGACDPTNFLDSTEENFDFHCAVNLKSKINVSQIVAKKMIADKRPGSIVNVSADATTRPLTALSSYCIVYGGIDQLTKIMAIELGPHNIRVNSVNPGPVDTEINLAFHPETNPEHFALFERYNKGMLTAKKSADVEDIVGPILFFLSNASAMITGSMLPIEGGYLVN